MAGNYQDAFAPLQKYTGAGVTWRDPALAAAAEEAAYQRDLARRLKEAELFAGATSGTPVMAGVPVSTPRYLETRLPPLVEAEGALIADPQSEWTDADPSSGPLPDATRHASALGKAPGPDEFYFGPVTARVRAPIDPLLDDQ